MSSRDEGSKCMTFPSISRLFGRNNSSANYPSAPAKPGPPEIPSGKTGQGAVTEDAGRQKSRKSFIKKLFSSKREDKTLAETKPIEPIAPSLDPWSRAYTELKNEANTRTLVETYEKILTYRADPANPTDEEIPVDTPNQFATVGEADRVKELATTLQPVLDKYQQEKWWKTAAEGVNVVVSKIGKGVGNALASCPPAALAWSAICLVVPILVQPIKQEKQIAEGLEYVLERMDWYIPLTNAILKREWADSHPFKQHQRGAETESVKLFKAMLKFQMECACRAFDEHPVVRVVSGILALGDWGPKLENIKILDTRIYGNFQQYLQGELTEYSSQTAENTEALLSEVRQIKVLLAGTNLAKKADGKTADISELIKGFGDTTYLDQMCLNPERHPGTCEWFRGHKKYKEWLASPQNDLLLVTAEPGCGKSVLSRFLVQHDLPARKKEKGSQEPIVLYFFFKDNTIQKSVLNALGAIIHQLLKSSAAAAADFESQISANPDMLRGPATLWDLFKDVSEHNAFQNRTIYCVFDALDECDPTGRDKLIERLQTNVKQNCRVQFLVTTRPYPNIVESFHRWADKPVSLEGDGLREKDDLQKEIDIVFQYRIDSLVEAKSLTPEGSVASLIKTDLKTKGAGQRTYLWVRLVFELLEKKNPANLDDWKALLDDLPEGIFGTYDKLLSNVSEEYRDRILSLLHIIYIAETPLDIAEANIAVHIRGNYRAKSIASLGLDDQSFRAWLRNECGFFITEYDGRLFFIHQTAREFLRGSSGSKSNKTAEATEGDGHESTAANAWSNSIKSDEEAHFVMAECCLASMMATWRDADVKETAEKVEFAYNRALVPFEPTDSDRDQNSDEAQDFARSHASATESSNHFFEYSKGNWLKHFKGANLDLDDSIKKRASAELGPKNTDEPWAIRRRPTWHDISEDQSLGHRIPSGSPLSDTTALRAAYMQFLTYPMRSVFTSLPNIKIMRTIESETQSVLRQSEGRCEVRNETYRALVKRMYAQMKVDTIMRCSPLVWACIFEHAWAVRAILSKADSGGPENLHMHSPPCGHGELFEFTMSLAVIMSPRWRSSINILKELLQHAIRMPKERREIIKYFFEGFQVTNEGRELLEENYDIRQLLDILGDRELES